MIAAGNVDFVSLANSIRDSDIKFIFKKITKKNVADRVSALNQLMNFIPKLDYHTTFSEIVGHICVLFEHLFFDCSEAVRCLAIKMMGLVIAKLHKDVAGYASLIFPTLLLYMHDTIESVAKEAKECFDTSFPTPEKKKAVIMRMQGDICEKVSTFVSNLTISTSSESWGRVAAATMNLASFLIKAIKMNKTLKEMLESFEIQVWLRNDHGVFPKNSTTTMRIAAYSFINTTSQVDDCICDTSFVLDLSNREVDPSAQSALLTLILNLMDSGKLDKEEIKRVFTTNICLYVDPTINMFMDFMNRIGDSEFLCNCIESVVKMDDVDNSKRLFDVLTGTFDNGMKPPKEYLVSLFQRIVSDEIAGDFISNAKCFDSLRDTESIDDVLLNGNEEKCIEFVGKLSEEKLVKWLQTREKVTCQLMIRVCEQFSGEVVRQVWDTLDSVPLLDPEGDLYIEFLVRFINTSEFVALLKKDQDMVPVILMAWKRDWSILRCKELKELAIVILDEHISLASIFKAIFQGDEEVLEIIHAVIDTCLMNANFIDPSLLDTFSLDEDFLARFLRTGNASSLPKDYPIVARLIETLPQMTSDWKPIELARVTYDFVKGVGINPLEIKFNHMKDTELCCEFWSYFNFEGVDPHVMCEFLECYLTKKVPWIKVFLYIKEIDWHVVPQKLWESLGSTPGLAQIAHDQGLLVALACICAANELTLSDLPFDALTLQAMPHIEPPRDDSDDKLIRIIHMEWNHMRPSIPNFKDYENIELLLRQTIVYLRFYLPTLFVFDPIYDLLVKGLENPDRLTFFYCVRIFGMVCEATKDVPAVKIIRLMMPYLVKFAPFITVIENELTSAFKITSFLSIEDFTSIVVDSASLFATPMSTQLIRVMIPLFQYFNAWDLIESHLNGALDVHDPRNWNLITHCLFEMPAQKRITLLPHFARFVPSVLDKIDMDDYKFEQIVIAFPFTAREWFDNLDATQQKLAREVLQKRVTVKVFKSIVKNTLYMKLPNTTIKSNQQRLSMEIAFKEDVNSMPITLKIELPETYPLEPISIHSDIGDRQMSQTCDERLTAAMKSSQSVEEGIRTWHSFVIARVLDATPCTICYSYFDANNHAPSVKCETCSNSFHKACLRKWFERCHKPTCPYCAYPWRGNGKTKKGL